MTVVVSKRFCRALQRQDRAVSGRGDADRSVNREDKGNGVNIEVKKENFECALRDWTSLTDKLIQRLARDNTIVVGIDIRSMTGSGRGAIGRHPEMHEPPPLPRAVWGPPPLRIVP
jgi:hypothetical protein